MLTAAALVGLLAEPNRRRVIAALILDASTPHEISRQTGLSIPDVVTALGRLEAAGLVLEDMDDFQLLGEAFGVAARASAADRRLEREHDGPDARVLNAFVRDGRILSIPMAHSKRLVLVAMLAQEFEPGRRYSEKMVNLMLGKWHDDAAAWRRYLVDEGFMDRDEGEYWRSGGQVSVG